VELGEFVGALIKLIFMVYFLNSAYVLTKNTALFKFNCFPCWVACVITLSFSFWYLCLYSGVDGGLAALACVLLIYIQRDRWRDIAERKSIDRSYKDSFNVSHGDLKLFVGRASFAIISAALWAHLYSGLYEYM